MKSFDELIHTMEILMGENGCPWDREQTHESIRINCIEEAYEVVDAIDGGERDQMIEELGDLLLQSLFHCLIAKREGSFDIEDVLGALNQKLISRHIHIFGGESARSGDEALSRWEAQKDKQKNYKSKKQKMESLPKVFPTLLRAEKVVKYEGDSKEGLEGELCRAFDCYKNNSSEQSLGALLVALVRNYRAKGLFGEVALNRELNKIIDRQ